MRNVKLFAGAVLGLGLLAVSAGAEPADRFDCSEAPPAASADGRFVVFSSEETDLVAGQRDTNEDVDVFVFDRETGTTTLVSRAAGTTTTTGDGGSGEASISADGRWISFTASADNLVAGQAESSESQVFLFDRIEETVTLVSHSAAVPTAGGDGSSWESSLSADGTLLAYSSTATDLVAGLTDPRRVCDVFLYDRRTGLSRLISRSISSPTVGGNRESFLPFLSADGSLVAFRSSATDLVPPSEAPSSRVFLFRISSETVIPVSEGELSRDAKGNLEYVRGR